MDIPTIYELLFWFALAIGSFVYLLVGIRKYGGDTYCEVTPTKVKRWQESVW